MALNAVVGEPGEERDGGDEIGVEDLRGGVKVLLRVGLIAEDAVGEVGDVHAGEGVDGVGEQRGVLVGIVEVGYGGVYVAGSAGAEVGGYGFELGLIAGYEEEAGALCGPDAAGGFGYAGCGSEDEDFQWSNCGVLCNWCRHNLGSSDSLDLNTTAKAKAKYRVLSATARDEAARLRSR